MSVVPRSAIHIFRVNWQNRQVVLDLVRREFRLRYLGSLFGSYWNLIHPVAMIAIFSAIFSQTMRVRIGGAGMEGPLAYTIYLCSGLLAWNAFTDMVLRGTRVFLDNSTLIKKVSFPIEVLPSIVIGSATINFVIAYSIFLLLVLASGAGLSQTLLSIPLIFALQAVLAVGIVMLTSVLNVFFRDIEQILSIGLQMWFWLTPIVYTEQNVPEAFRVILQYNPMYYFISAYHAAVVDKAWPSPEMLAVCAGIAALALVGGAAFMTRFKHDIPDEL